MIGLLTASPDGVRVSIRVSPRASRNAVGPVREGSLVVAVTSPPVEGEANEAVVKTLAKWLGVPVRRVSLVLGERGRQKIVEVAGLSVAELQAKLDALSAP